LGDSFFAKKIASCTLKSYEKFVNIDSSAGATAVAIKLPPVAEMCGEMIVLYVTGFSGAITVTAADSVDFSAPDFGEANDGALLYSDGVHWWTLAVRT
jgi:hypothetical protein